MQNQPITPERLDAARLVVSRMLGLRPGHACEAVAAALGHRTHAALTAALRADADLREPSAILFRIRLLELGHPVPTTASDRALAMAFGFVPEFTRDVDRLGHLVRMGRRIADAGRLLVAGHPGARDMLLALQPIPDEDVATFSVGRDTLRWNPGHVATLGDEGIRSALVAAALHRAAAHPLRRGDRDPVVWCMACDHVVNDHLAGLGLLPGSVPRDGRYGAHMLPEDVYVRVMGETRITRPRPPGFAFEAWKGRPPARPGTIADVAAGLLRPSARPDDRMLAEGHSSVPAGDGRQGFRIGRSGA